MRCRRRRRAGTWAVSLLLLGGAIAEGKTRVRPKKIKDDTSAPTLSYDRFRKGVELQAAAKRDDQIAGLLRLLELGADEAEIPDIKFRLGELYYEKAGFYFFRAQEADERRVAAEDEAG